MNLHSYDLILLNTSAGKDSQTAMGVMVAECKALGLTHKLRAVHCDLGRVEWEGTRELAEEQCRAYGVPLTIISRKQDLLDQVAQRGKWPSPAQRYCTSDHKRAQVHKVLTAMTAELQLGRQARILNVMGIRAEESPARAKKSPFAFDKLASNSKRHVTTYYPIFDWSVEQVWTAIRQSGVRHHHAYDLGMPRLSCVFCIFAPQHALTLAGKHNPQLLAEYVAVEQATGHTFRKDQTLVDIAAAVNAGTPTGAIADNWGSL